MKAAYLDSGWEPSQHPQGRAPQKVTASILASVRTGASRQPTRGTPVLVCSGSWASFWGSSPNVCLPP